MTPRRLYRVVALTEAVTWTLLLSALLARALDPGLAAAVSVAGGIHGFVFLAYAAVALLTALHQRWRVPVAMLAVGSAVVPFATVPVELWLRRTGRLDGPWRRDATADPRDHTPIDRLLRWLVRHPLLLVVAALVAVAALFTVLLLVGPPVPRA